MFTFSLCANLVFHNSIVPCYKRCKEIEYTEEHEKVIDGDDAEGGWVDTHHFAPLSEQVQEMTLGDKAGPSSKSAQKQPANDDEDDEEEEDEAANMEDFLESGLIDDDEVRG